MESNLGRECIILRLTISQWGARKQDKKVTKEVDEKHKAKNAGIYTKRLMQGKIDEIRTLANEARRYIYQNTLPWGDNGDRLLNISKYAEIQSTLQDYQSKWNDLINVIAADYELQIEKEKIRLGKLFNKSDYPSKEQLWGKFDFRFSYFPLPQPNHFVVALVDNEVAKIKEQIETENKRLLAEANGAIWNKIYEAIYHVAERLGDVNNIFRDSLIDNLKILCKQLKELNVMKDQKLDEMLDRIENLIANLIPEDLRINRRLRKETFNEVSSILEDIDKTGKRKIHLE